MALEDLLKTKRELIAAFDLSEEEATELLSINKNLYKEELARTLGLTDQAADLITNDNFNQRARNEQQQTRPQRQAPKPQAAPQPPAPIRTQPQAANQPIDLTSLGLTRVTTIAATTSDININRSSSSSTNHSSGSSSSSRSESRSLHIVYKQPTITFSNPNGICFYRAIAISNSTAEPNLNQEIVRLKDLAIAQANTSNQPDPSNIQALTEYVLLQSGILNNNNNLFNLNNLMGFSSITPTAEELAQQTNNQAANIDNMSIGELEKTGLMHALRRPICIIKSNNSVSIIENTAATGEPLFVYYHVNNNHYDGLTVNPGINARAILNNLRNRQDAPRPSQLRRTI
jgi:hypothetical protein